MFGDVEQLLVNDLLTFIPCAVGEILRWTVFFVFKSISLLLDLVLDL